MATTLRPDRIFGAFHVDSSAPPVLKVNESLHLADFKQRGNIGRIDAAVSSIWAVDEVNAIIMENNTKELSIQRVVGNVATAINVQKQTKGSMGTTFRPMEGGDIEMNAVTRTDKTNFKSEEDEDLSISTSPLFHEMNSFGGENELSMTEEGGTKQN
jgi:hypothetical protein